jgi:threonine/homoserine/homoserine lactone efflux protein
MLPTRTMDQLLPLASFAFVTSITPGPNNLMLAASGLGFGMRRSIPPLLGVSAGFAALILCCGLGVGVMLSGLPAAALVLKVAGTAYLGYLAWSVRSAAVAGDGPTLPRPWSFAAAAAFQFANPKAWIMALTCTSMFLPELGPGWMGLALLCLVACAVNLPCVATWALAGSSLRRTLTDPRWQKRCTTMLAALTVYAAAAIWI